MHVEMVRRRPDFFTGSSSRWQESLAQEFTAQIGHHAFVGSIVAASSTFLMHFMYKRISYSSYEIGRVKN